MKLKPIYIYVALIIVALVTLITISSNNDVANSNETVGDEINSSMINKGNMEPSSANINPKIIEQMKELESYVNSNISDTAKVKEYADMLMAAHNKDKAIEYYKKILDVSADRTDILKILAINDFNDGDYRASRARIVQILSLEPNNPETLYNMGVIETKMGNIEAAREQWENLLKFHPNTKMSEIAKQSLAKLDK